MLTRERYPKVVRRNPSIEGGHRLGSFSYEEYLMEDDQRGAIMMESEPGFEACVLDEGEKLEAYATDTEVAINYDNLISVYYDRENGSLKTACFSLVKAVETVSDGDLRMRRKTVRVAEELKAKGMDVIVVTNFDKDGEVRISVVLTERGEVIRLIGVGKQSDLKEDYRWAEEPDNEEDDPEYEVDFVIEGEEEAAGQLIMAWRYMCEMLELDMGVGIREEFLDFVVCEPDGEYVRPFHVAQTMDLSLLDDRKLDVSRLQLLVLMAFPKMDWI